MNDLPPHQRLLDALRGFGERFVDLREWCYERWETTLGRGLEAVGDAFDSFEALEDAIVRLVTLAVWPVRKLGGWLGLGRLAAGLAAAGAAVGARLSRDAVPEKQSGLANRVGDWVYVLLTPVRAVTGFAYAWCVTRRPRELALATPALVMLLPFAYVAVWGAVRDTTSLVERYQLAVRDAEENGEEATADLMRRKLEQLGASNERTDYLAAYRLEQEGDLAGALKRMLALAPTDQRGFLPAHDWITNKAVTGELTDELTAELSPAGAAALGLKHLEHIADARGRSERTALARTLLLARSDQPQAALKAVEPYAGASVTAAGFRLKLLLQLSRTDEAADQAERLLTLHRDRPEEPEPRVDELQTVVLAANLLGDAAGVEAALLDLRSKAPLDAQQNTRLAAASGRLAERQLAAGGGDAEQLAERVLRVDAVGGSAVGLIGRLAAQRRASPFAARAWDLLLASPDATDRAVELAGTAAATTGEIVQARKAYRQLIDRDAASPGVWNNLAWALLQEPRPHHAEALRVVGRALDADPANPHYLETRGQALLKLKRYREAIADLELALNAMPNAKQIHTGLAAAYAALGETQTASLHRDLADH